MAEAARVFISYSSKDSDIVDRLKVDLADAGARVWLDHEQLTPGTPNWQVKVREGIGQATTVVYVASETAAVSPFVYDEISIARNKGKAVIPFWARGVEWHDCAPLGFGATQYTDGRGAAYPSGVARLLATLGASAPVRPQATSAPTAPTAPTAPRPAPPAQPTYPLPTLPARLAGLGFRGVNPNGTPAIVPPLVTVAAGPFQMGSDTSRDREADDSETPQHRVELAAFQIGKYPVTVAEYALAVQAGAVREPPQYQDATWQVQLQRLDHPAVCVSWQDTQAYLTWLRAATGEASWRLPSEAEWEKAARWDARANTSRLYPWGEVFDQYRCNTRESGIGATTPVGAYPASDARRSGASPCGAEDMAGNVWERTSSVFKPYPYTASDGREAQDSTESRVLRGGSWGDVAKGARAAFRLDYGPVDSVGGSGFRLALARPSAGS